MSPRNQSLDALRGIAVLSVIVHHYAGATDSFLHIGMVGVNLFFVLSGFLISGLLFYEFKSTGRICLWRFFVRRGLKIYPPFYTFLLLTLPISANVGLSRFWSAAPFLQSYRPHFWQHTWSLSAEEIFYVGLPIVLLLLFVRFKHFGAIPWIAVGLVVICAGLRSRASVDQFSEAHLRAILFLPGLRVALLACTSVFFLPPIYFILLGRHLSYLLFLLLIALAYGTIKLALNLEPPSASSVFRASPAMDTVQEASQA